MLNQNPKHAIDNTSAHRATTGRGFMTSVRAGFTLVELPVVSGRERKAFTLVELLVVITIIAILAGLISVAAVNAVWTAKQMRIKAEVDQLDMAMKAFRQKYGAYPPCDLRVADDTTSNPALRAFLARAFPRYTRTSTNLLDDDLQAAGVDTTTFNPAGALLFWLRGFNPDVTQPFATSTSRNAFFDFDQTRLLRGEPFVDANNDGVWNTGESYTDINGSGAYNRYPEYYVPVGGQNVPYVYFDSRVYRIAAAGAVRLTQIALGGSIATPYALDVNGNRILDSVAVVGSSDAYTDANANGTYDTGETVTDTNSNGQLDFLTDTWANAESFQIISAGQDGLFSATTTTSSNVRQRLYPAGNGYDTEDNDNVTNFCDRASLEDARP